MSSSDGGGLPRALRLFAMSGSLRAGASNTALLEACALLAPPAVTVELYGDVDRLPPFNPDLDRPDGIGLPGIVAGLRAAVGRADAILVSSPEYAHGIPGSFKNALDWLVGSEEFPGKLIALISASSRSIHVKAQLTEVLTTMSGHLVPGACATIDMAGRSLDGRGVAADPAMSTVLRGALDALIGRLPRA